MTAKTIPISGDLAEDKDAGPVTCTDSPPAAPAAWRLGASDLRVLASMVSVGAVAAMVKLVGAGKEVVVARQLGVSDTLDAFLLAFGLFTFVDTVLVQSAIIATLPSYVALRENGDEAGARDLIRVITGRGLLMLAALTVVAAGIGPPVLHLLGGGFSTQKLALTQRLFVIMVPGVIFSGVSTVAEAMLHARNRFTAVAVAPIGVPIITAALISTPAVHWHYSLGVATLGGFLCECLILLTVLWRSSLLVTPRVRGRSEHLPAVVAQYFPAVMGAVIFAAAPLVDQAIAASRAPGSVATLGYASRITSVVLGIVALALTTAVFPHFSKIAARQEWGALWKTFRAYGLMVLIGSLPATLILVSCSHQIVQLIYQRGQFTAATSTHVANVQRLLALEIPWYLIGIMGVRLLSAIRRNRALFWIGAINFVVNWVADYIFAVFLGLPGIALSTSLVYFIAMIVIIHVVRRDLRARIAAAPD